MFTGTFPSRAALLLLTTTIGACGSGGGEPAATTPGSTASTASTATDTANAVTPDPNAPPTAAATDLTAATLRRRTPGQASGSTSPTPPASTTPDAALTASAALAANTLGSLTSSGPIVIDAQSNVTITGRRISNPGGPCIVLRNGASNVTITGNEIGPCGSDGIRADGSSNLTVTRNNLHGITGVGVLVNDSSAITGHNNYIDGAYTAMRAVRSTRVDYAFNGAINIRGPFPDGQFAQFDNVSGTGNRIRCNTADLTIGAPDPATWTTTATIRTEDMINTWQSHGDAGDPVLIAHNRLKGGGSATGSGIMAGDGGGAYITVTGNRIVNPWNAGIGVAGGSNIRIESNRVFSDLPNAIANEGFYIRNFYPSACYAITHQYNQIKWPPADWSATGWTQTFWSTGECSGITGTQTNDLNAPLTAAIFTEPIPECRALATTLGYSTAGY